MFWFWFLNLKVKRKLFFHRTQRIWWAEVRRRCVRRRWSRSNA